MSIKKKNPLSSFQNGLRWDATQWNLNKNIDRIVIKDLPQRIVWKDPNVQSRNPLMKIYQRFNSTIGTLFLPQLRPTCKYVIFV